MKAHRLLDVFRPPPKDAFFISYRGRTFTCPRRAAPDHILDQMRRRRAFYEADLLAVLNAKVAGRKGVALDIGANVGNHSLFFAGVMGLRTAAFEPVSENRDLVKRMAELNRLEDRISIHPFACSDSSGQAVLRLAVEGNPGTYAISDHVGTGGEVADLVRLDDIVPSLFAEDQPVVLMKVDVEGSEASVLRGARETIERHAPVISVEAASLEAFEEAQAILAEFGYSPATVKCATPTVVFTREPGRSSEAEVRDRIAAHERKRVPPCA